jgi:hypothetical protein
LAKQFEPILFFSANERFFPADAKRYVEHCALWRAQAPFDVKDSWGGKGGTFPRAPIIDYGKISALAGEPGTPLDAASLVDNQGEERFFDFKGWMDAARSPQPKVTATSKNTFSNRDAIDTAYNKSDADGGDAKLRDSRFWYHAELIEADRLRRLLATVRAPDLVKVYDTLKNAALLNYYLFYPAHEEGLADCTNTEAVEFGCRAGEWGCLSLLLERADPNPTTDRPTSERAGACLLRGARRWRKRPTTTAQDGNGAGCGRDIPGRRPGRRFCDCRLWRALSRWSARRACRSCGHRRRLQDRQCLLGAENLPSPDCARGFGGRRVRRIPALRRQILLRRADRAVVAISEGELEVARGRKAPRSRGGGCSRNRPRNHRLLLRAVEASARRRPAGDPCRYHRGDGRHRRASVSLVGRYVNVAGALGPKTPPEQNAFTSRIPPAPPKVQGRLPKYATVNAGNAALGLRSCPVTCPAVAWVPTGATVRIVSSGEKGWPEVETTMVCGATFHGFADGSMLRNP